VAVLPVSVGASTERREASTGREMGMGILIFSGMGVWGTSQASLAEYGVEPRPETSFDAF